MAAPFKTASSALFKTGDHTTIWKSASWSYEHELQ